MNLKRSLIAASAVLVILACVGLTPVPPTPTPTLPVPSDTPTTAATLTDTPTTAPTDTPTTAAPTLPSGTGPCQATSDAGLTTYERPSYEAEVFSTVQLSPVPIGSRTADGWLGFDPMKAQAANIGIFRMRWIPPGAAINLTGDCASVPIADWVPAPGVCYEMTMEAVDVHAAADATSAVTGTLNVGDFAAIQGQTASGWVLVSGDQANTPGVNGFIPESATNVNGPCDSIPTVPG